MGTEHSTISMRDALSQVRSQRDVDVPHTIASISKSISSDLFRQSPLMHRVRCQQTLPEKLRDQSKAVMSPKHDIVVVAHGTTTEKDSNPELTKLNTIPFCLPIIPSSVLSEYKSSSTVGHLDHATLLMMCLRYQDHLRQLSEAVAFDQNALCVPIKEINNMIQAVMSTLRERHKRYFIYVEQLHRITEMATTLTKVTAAIDDIIPSMDQLNQLLPSSEQLESFSMSSLPMS